MSGKLIRKVVLFLVIFFLPFSFFYFFSLGSHSFERLLFYGSETEEPFVFPDFEVQGRAGELTKKELDGKIKILTWMRSSCPYECGLGAKQFRYYIYREIEGNQRKYNDVVVFSQLLDTAGCSLQNAHEKMEVDPQSWIYYTSKDSTFLDVRLNGNYLKTFVDPKYPDEIFFPRAVLLVDKSWRIRGFYDGSQTIELKRLLEELRLLKKEYDQEEHS